ncbi:MAG: AMP-binding protein [Bdellovibrionales bacterium]|nr:AMP-binding protein [Bdellovibrionales bacterium]
MDSKFLRVNDTSIDWESRDSHFFFNIRHPQFNQWQELVKHLPFFPGCLYLFTSSYKKIAILPKESFLISARAVNQHLRCTEKDRWLVVLPFTHTGGLSILARSFCGSYSSFKGPEIWNPKTFLDVLKEKKMTLCSLVPAQVYDLVKNRLSAPPTLRAVVVGGGALSPSLYTKARELKWPLLPSYGLTELCSQVATASLSSLENSFFPELKILPHTQLKVKKGTLHIQSKALLKGYFDLEKKKFWDPKSSEGWFDTGDIGKVEGENLTVKGRKDNQIKILGELTDLTELSHQLESLVFDLTLTDQFILIPVSNERKGWDLQIVTTSFNEQDILKVIRKFNKTVAPFQRVKTVYSVEKLPETDILKPSLDQIKKQIRLKYTNSV